MKNSDKETYQSSEAFSRAVSLFNGDIKQARSWFSRQNMALDGKSPLNSIDSATGNQQVIDLIGRLEHGISS